MYTLARALDVISYTAFRHVAFTVLQYLNRNLGEPNEPQEQWQTFLIGKCQ